ncbi:MAG TPA: MFS transporter, partial [Roseiflexaceae bacterium]|nr:MFS transporter [Roseiflexaceae bacterium]
SLPRRKPMIMLATLGERLPFLVLGLLLLFQPGLPPATLLAIFFALYAVQTFSGGVAMTAWQDFIARLIPSRRWGTFFGLNFGLGGVLGVAGAAVATATLASQPFPQNFGILALICFSAQVVSYCFLSSTIEPPQPAAPRQPMGAFLGSIGPLLGRNAMFRRYLFCRGAIALGLTGHSFLTAAAIERFNSSAADIGLFTAVLLGMQAAAHLGLGALADRWGHKQVLELSTAMGLLALLLAYLAPTVSWFLPIFALVGAAQAGYQLSGFTLVFSFSSPSERPAYIGVSNTELMPVAALGPLLAGWLAEVTSYGALFIALMSVGVIGLLGLHWRVAAPVRPAPSGSD